jgi:hypothetical protein
MKTHILFTISIWVIASCIFGQSETEYRKVIINDNVNSKLTLPPPVNDNCASATNLAVNTKLCNQTTDQGSTQTGECVTNYAGANERTVWYRFTATSATMILNFIVTNSPNCFAHIRVYGPFAAGAGCIPACASAVYSGIQNGDPGNYTQITNLQTTGNNEYLIQVQGNGCGGPNDNHTNFCIGIYTPAANSAPSGASLISTCGSSFSGTSGGGYWNSGTGSGSNNLDGNNSTTCSGCASGADIPFIVNNLSWFQFCSQTAGTWQITVNGVSGCTLPAPNQGIQASVLTGTTTSFTNVGNSQNPISPGATWTSPTFAVSAGSCAWLAIDGFAGDACDYNVTLTNVSGGCLLPIEIASFYGRTLEGKNTIEWETITERNNDYFTLEKSTDGINWQLLHTVSGSNTRNRKKYSVIDNMVAPVINYYRLKQTDYDGIYTYFKSIVLDNSKMFTNRVLYVTDVLGNTYGTDIPTSPGIYFKRFYDGSVEKVVVR